MEGHKGPVLSIITIDPKDNKNQMPDDSIDLDTSTVSKNVEEEPKIYSCSLDNTIWFWDAKDMSTLSVLEHDDENSELSSMAYLPNCGLVATGHLDGSIRLWNQEIGTSVLLTANPVHWHKNTVSCMKASKYKNCEQLICGSFDGRISIWEIAKKSGGSGINTGVHP